MPGSTRSRSRSKDKNQKDEDLDMQGEDDDISEPYEEPTETDRYRKVCGMWIDKCEACCRPPCNPRIEELSKPTKRLLFVNFTSFAHVLPKERLEEMNQILREELAMPAEQAELCIRESQRSYKTKKKAQLEHLQAKRKIADMSREKQIRLMRRCIKETLKTAFYNAYFNPKQIIISERLRKLSTLIVMDLCKLMKCKVPDRRDTGRRAKFLFAVGDYFAYAIESLYFDIQVKNIETLEEIKKNEKDVTVVEVN